MATITKELLQICQELPAQKVEEVVDFARFLRQQVHSRSPETKEDPDAAWERIANDPRPRPNLDAFVKEALGEAKAELLDLKRL